MSNKACPWCNDTKVVVFPEVPGVRPIRTAPCPCTESVEIKEQLINLYASPDSPGSEAPYLHLARSLYKIVREAPVENEGFIIPYLAECIHADSVLRTNNTVEQSLNIVTKQNELIKQLVVGSGLLLREAVARGWDGPFSDMRPHAMAKAREGIKAYCEIFGVPYDEHQVALTILREQHGKNLGSHNGSDMVPDGTDRG